MNNLNDEQSKTTFVERMVYTLEPILSYWPVVLMLGAQVLAYALSYGFLKELFQQAHILSPVNVFERLGFILVFDVLLLIVWRFLPSRSK